MKVYLEIGEITKQLLNFITSGEYKTFIEATQGTTKEDGFYNACYVLPAILLTKCQDKIYK